MWRILVCSLSGGGEGNEKISFVGESSDTCGEVIVQIQEICNMQVPNLNTNSNSKCQFEQGAKGWSNRFL